MDVVTTSLEALIQRVTNPQNTKPDIAAIEAFCVMLTKENQGINIASKLLAKQIQATNENEALQALLLLDTCMRRCGPSFHAEVGKFRFLNEMIKLVSPKYLGKMTPSPVQDKILELLHSWTSEYPKETKIKEAFEMLRKQGVVKEDLVSSPSVKDTVKSSTSKNSIFDDEEKSRVLQKLLQSKNPDDLHAANRLIRAMVKEDENRVMQVSNRVMQLKSVHNNVKLLSDMLDSFSFEESSTDDFELITELYEACERLKPTVIVLANELDCNEEMLSEVLAANDALGQVVEKYARIVLLGKSKNQLAKSNGPSLLDFSNPVDIPSSEPNLTQVKSQVEETANNQSLNTNSKSDMEVLHDIFTSIGNSNSSTSVPDSPLLISDIDIMQPSIVSSKPNESDESPAPVDSKTKALDELNELGEILLKETLSSASINGFSERNKNLTRVPMNSINKSTDSQMRTDKIDNEVPPDVSQRIATTDKWSNDETYKDLKKQLEQLNIGKSNGSSNNVPSNNVDEVKIESESNKWNLTDSWIKEGSNELSKKQAVQIEATVNSETNCDVSKDDRDKNEESDDPLISISSDTEIRSLADIHVTLENIKPGTTPPLNVIEEKNGITVVLHFAADSPRPDVSVIVVTTMSKNSKSLSNYLFQAVVSKKCKCRLQPPSGTDLPAHNPFLPPSAITQIMLIANPRKEPISLKFMLSYTMDDETITEMGEVDQLPVL